MKGKEALFWRTHAGLRAWSCADSGLPPHYRRILGALHAPAPVEVLRDAIHDCSEHELFTWLDELDTLGFIETDRAAAAYYEAA